MKFNIPTPPDNYNASNMAAAFENIKQAMGDAVSPTQAVGGIMLQSADGSVYRITVSNAGVLTSTAVPLGIR
jgi:hypothetical protein